MANADLSSLQALMEAGEEVGTGLLELPIAQIEPDPDQPRTNFDQAALRDLSASIQAQGVVQPVVVRPLDGANYRLVAGERRWRAARMAGLEVVPAVVRDVDGTNIVAVQLIENVDRQNLSVIEESLAVVRLITETKAKPGQVARLLGKPGAWVSLRRKIGNRPAVAAPFVDSGVTRDAETLAMLLDIAVLDPDRYQRFLRATTLTRATVREALAEAKDRARNSGKKRSSGGDLAPAEQGSAPSADAHGGAGAKEAVTPAGDESGAGDSAPAPASAAGPRKRRSRSVAADGSSSPGVDSAALSAEQLARLREAERDLHRVLQQPVSVVPIELGGAAVHIQCDSLAQLLALVKRLV